MATQYIISFRDKRSLGSTEAIQSLIREQFPTAKFHWTTSGLEKLRIAKERGIKFPPALLEGLESLPSLLECVCEGPGWRVEFCLGHVDPVTELIAEPRSGSNVVIEGLDRIEKVLGTCFRIHGTEAVD